MQLPPEKSSEKAVRLRAIRTDFLGRLGPELDRMQEGVPLEEQLGFLHRIKGTAGSCGFHQLGEAAAELHASLGNTASAEVAQWDRLTESYREAQAELQVSEKESRAVDPAEEEGRVLCIEDDPDIASLFRLALQGGGYGLEVITDGAKGWERLQQEPVPTLILMDLMLPGLDGFSLLERVRASERLRAVPVVVISARVLDEERRRAIEFGADAFLPKPFDIDHLEQLVKELIQHAS